jgi:predicted ATPase
LHAEGVLTTLGEANALLKAAGMAPLFDGQSQEATLLNTLNADRPPHSMATPDHPLAAPRLSNLPASLTRFVGREREKVEVRRLLGTTRLLTLTGAGGCGKTRLAIEVGASLVPETDQGRDGPATFPDGVWLVELAPVAEAAQVAEATMAVLGLQATSRTALAVLADHLRDRRLLLLLDNCEHLIQACAELAEALLRACPRLHLLATSRERLNVPGEVTWRVPSLAPDEAAQLFEARARAARPDFFLTATNATSVTHICRRLDNMPLALELAAARVRTFSVEQIASRLDDAFRVLVGGSRTALARQQTLWATIDWSYYLLSNEERTLLGQLSVFAGGWTLEATEAINGADAAQVLEQLVDKSLVVAEEKPAGMRYHLLEVMRQYAHARLADAGVDAERQLRQRHLQYFTHLVQTARPRLSAAGAERKLWMNILVAETDNLRAALSSATQYGEWQIGTKLILGVAPIWNERGYISEVSKWIDVLILSSPAASDTTRATGLLMMADTVGSSGDLVGAIDWLRKASALAHQIGDERVWLESDANLGIYTPDYVEATTLLNQVLQYAQQTGRTSDELMAVQFLGTRMSLHGECQQAANLLERGAVLAHERALVDARTDILWRLGQAYLEYADYARARAALEESLALSRKDELLLWPSWNSLIDLGTVGLYTHDEALAREALSVCLPYHLETNNLERVAQGLVLAAGLAQALGQPNRAARLLGTAAAIRRDHHTHGVFERELFAEYDRHLPAVRAALDPAEFDRAWAEGQKLTIKEAIAEALAV